MFLTYGKDIAYILIYFLETQSVLDIVLNSASSYTKVTFTHFQIISHNLKCLPFRDLQKFEIINWPIKYSI